ncbi:MAG: hypothetical protein FWD57_14570 [Polyangiaceae bacterium]|nr:hypothetical protein [Polyangiaceae bacterium]
MKLDRRCDCVIYHDPGVKGKMISRALSLLLLFAIGAGGCGTPAGSDSKQSSSASIPTRPAFASPSASGSASGSASAWVRATASASSSASAASVGSTAGSSAVGNPADSSYSGNDSDKGPEVLAAGSGFGKILAVSDGNLFWAVDPSSPTSQDGRIVRMPRDGGVYRDVAGGLDKVTSIAFDDMNLYWTMCGISAHVQRCRVTRVPKGGGKRSLVFDAGPTMVTHAASAWDIVAWAEPGANRLMKSTGQTTPTAFVSVSDVTDVASSGNSIVWAEGRGFQQTGSIKQVGSSGAVTTVAKGRRFPRHLCVDGRRAFWVETSAPDAGAAANEIVAVGLDGGEPTTIAGGLPHVEGMAVAASRIVVAFAESIEWLPATGGDRVVVASKQKVPVSPVADQTHAYWISEHKVWRMSLATRR